MAFNITSLLGASPIGSIDTTAKFAVGTIVKATDNTGLGEAQFVYLPGVASTAVGLVVVYDLSAVTTTLGVAGSRGPAAVATAANTATTSYAWYQVEGLATVKETGATAGANVYWTATAGTPSATTVSGDKVDGIRFKTADGTPAAGTAYAMLAFPSANANG